MHHQDLIERPQDFGEIFLGRVLGASLFQAVDYVQAQRECRTMLLEMRPLYEKFDVLGTIGGKQEQFGKRCDGLFGF